MRIRIIKDIKSFKKGSVVNVSPNEGFGLIDSGIGVLTKDMVEQDYKTLDEEQANGYTTKLRTHNRRRS